MSDLELRNECHLQVEIFISNMYLVRSIVNSLMFSISRNTELEWIIVLFMMRPISKLDNTAKEVWPKYDTRLYLN